MHLSGNAANVCVFGWPKVHLRVAPQKEWNEDNAVVGLARVLFGPRARKSITVLVYYFITVLLHYCISVAIEM